MQAASKRNTMFCLPVLGALALASCATPQQQVAQEEDSLAAAGFVQRPANTADREAMLKRLPPAQFVRRVRGDNVSYVFADPLVCHCLYVGGQQAYDTFQRDRLQKQLADEQMLAAQSYQDANWNWGPWGYDGFGGTFGGFSSGF